MHCRLDSKWSSGCVVALWLLVPLACSDDGVPQQETGETGGNTDSTLSGTSPTTDDPATTSPTNTTDSTTSPSTTDPGTTTDPSTTDPTDTDPGSTGSADSTGTGSDTTDASSSSGDSSSGDSSSGSSSDGGTGVLETGAKCIDDGDCASGVCWDFNDYDQLCFGAACSVECVTDDDCEAAFEAAGAPSPEGSTCGNDGRCAVLGTGFGAFACAMQPAVLLGGV